MFSSSFFSYLTWHHLSSRNLFSELNRIFSCFRAMGCSSATLFFVLLFLFVLFFGVAESFVDAVFLLLCKFAMSSLLLFLLWLFGIICTFLEPLLPLLPSMPLLPQLLCSCYLRRLLLLSLYCCCYG